MPNLVDLHVHPTILASVGGLKIWGTLGSTPPLKMGRLPGEHDRPTSIRVYHGKFGHSKSNRLYLAITIEILRQSLILHVPPFKVPQGHRNYTD